MTPDLFQREHDGHIPVGLLRTVAPAAPDAWITALERHGTMTFGEVAEASIRLARDGFVMYPLMASVIAKKVGELRPLAVQRGDLPARWQPACRRRCLRAGRSRALPPVHGG